jgi:hypothetical protein
MPFLKNDNFLGVFNCPVRVPRRDTKSNIHKPTKMLVLSLPKHRGSAQCLPLQKGSKAGIAPTKKLWFFQVGFGMSRGATREPPDQNTPFIYCKLLRK